MKISKFQLVIQIVTFFLGMVVVLCAIYRGELLKQAMTNSKRKKCQNSDNISWKLKLSTELLNDLYIYSSILCNKFLK